VKTIPFVKLVSKKKLQAMINESEQREIPISRTSDFPSTSSFYYFYLKQSYLERYVVSDKKAQAIIEKGLSKDKKQILMIVKNHKNLQEYFTQPIGEKRSFISRRNIFRSMTKPEQNWIKAYRNIHKDVAEKDNYSKVIAYCEKEIDKLRSNPVTMTDFFAAKKTSGSGSTDDISSILYGLEEDSAGSKETKEAKAEVSTKKSVKDIAIADMIETDEDLTELEI